jgi:hypothetical protein
MRNGMIEFTLKQTLRINNHIGEADVRVLADPTEPGRFDILSIDLAGMTIESDRISDGAYHEIEESVIAELADRAAALAELREDR